MTQTLEYGSLREKIAAESVARKAKYAGFEALYAEAVAAGTAALTAAKPTPIVVGSPSTLFGSDVDRTKEHWFVPEGCCGFAWIKVRPGNSPFANWLKKTKKVSGAAYSGGVDIWVSEGGQSVERKEAYARAFAKVLQAAGINCYADSRLD